MTPALLYWPTVTLRNLVVATTLSLSVSVGGCLPDEPRFHDGDLGQSGAAASGSDIGNSGSAGSGSTGSGSTGNGGIGNSGTSTSGTGGTGGATSCSNTCSAAESTRCSEGELETCERGDDGCLAWSVPTACAEGFCADSDTCGACSNACSSVGQTTCSGQQIASCVEDGNGCFHWGDASTCPGGSAYWCDGNSCQCHGTCSGKQCGADECGNACPSSCRATQSCSGNACVGAVGSCGECSDNADCAAGLSCLTHSQGGVVLTRYCGTGYNASTSCVSPPTDTMRHVICGRTYDVACGDVCRSVGRNPTNTRACSFYMDNSVTCSCQGRNVNPI